ncbi:ArsR family transcriptional regulator [Haloterrigena sp. H1]|uniref:DUF7344 domain-containing protein n=1 Tax=Haloterrigena sp. H1 TaxID=2552943 RepID=UPI00110EDBEC|nr:ArsR family transcriptional regulator [Haloterrigena sp. H1]TMT77986.1 ArsR family transcriptional regulator [Haloterrigena sp. H1]TMT80275.1 ArsR family transcriptional regulator [Haloterrigena sp. H1]
MTGRLDTGDVNQLFDLLRNPRRRYVLYYLTNHADPVEFDTLASELAAWEANDTGMTATDETVESIRTTLHHIHLPKLADTGVVTVDSESETVELCEIDGLDTFLTDTAEIEWNNQIAADD